MSRRLRMTSYLCRAPLCKNVNRVFEWIDRSEAVVTTAPSWQGYCGRCGRGSLDIQFQKVFDVPSTGDPFSPSAPWDGRRL